MKIGVIFTAYQAADLITDSLARWLAYKDLGDLGLEPHRITIAAVCVPFEGFPGSTEDDGTLLSLSQCRERGDIAHLVTSEVPLKETEARGRALRYLVEAGVDIVIQADGDEIPTLDEIRRIFAFVESRPHHVWFRICLKNRVFTRDQYLVEPFTPPRIHRVNVGGYRAHSFWDDNNVAYGGTITRDIRRDVDFPNCTVPKSAAWVEHLTWLNDLRSLRKATYQWARWQRCDYDWDDSRGGLIWRDGVTPQETAHD